MIAGLGEVILERYGREFLEEIRAYLESGSGTAMNGTDAPPSGAPLSRRRLLR
jgi:hypothetical protein